MKGNRKGSKKNDPELIEIDENRDEQVTMSRIENDRIEFPTSGGPIECAKDQCVKGILYIELDDSCDDLCWSNRIEKRVFPYWTNLRNLHLSLHKTTMLTNDASNRKEETSRGRN